MPTNVPSRPPLLPLLENQGVDSSPSSPDVSGHGPSTGVATHIGASLTLTRSASMLVLNVGFDRNRPDTSRARVNVLVLVSQEGAPTLYFRQWASGHDVVYLPASREDVADVDRVLALSRAEFHGLTWTLNGPLFTTPNTTPSAQLGVL